MPRVMNGSSATAHGLRSLTRARLGPISSCSAIWEPPVWRLVRLYADREADASAPTTGGYQLASPGMPGLRPASFGHAGAGDRLSIADADLDIAFAYACNSMRNIGPGGDPRWKTLLDAVHRRRLLCIANTRAHLWDGNRRNGAARSGWRTG
jgi:hypothetical protein